MENYTQKLRNAANQALEDGGLVRNAYDLAQKADMDPANLSKFLKAKEGKYDRISFGNAAAILGAIGGQVVFPHLIGAPVCTIAGAVSAVERKHVEELKKENEKLRNKLEALQEVLTELYAKSAESGAKVDAEKNQTSGVV